MRAIFASRTLAPALFIDLSVRPVWLTIWGGMLEAGDRVRTTMGIAFSGSS
jgi:hypothetical protein